MSIHNTPLKQQLFSSITTADGKLPFADFMQLALYAPGLGYYSGGQQKFGVGGDFITAPEISPLFSYALAEQCAEIFTQLPNASIVEFGAGTGIMAADILLHLEQLSCLPKHYLILEVSAELKQRQQNTIKQKAPHLAKHVSWLTQLPEEPLDAIVLANEVLDAMPVHVFRTIDDAWHEAFVTVENNDFKLLFEKSSNPQLIASMQALLKDLSLPNDYQSEINLLLAPWLKSVSDFLQRGVVLLIDYGFPRQDYYHPQRNTGTLQCFYQHQRNNDVLQRIGEQDITVNVDFTAVAEAAVDADFSVLGFTNQAFFLMNNHLLQLAEKDYEDEVERFNCNQQIKQLTLPTEMGEKFKVIALGKDYAEPLQGFSMGDKLHLL